MGKQSIIVNGVAYSHDQVVAGAFVANSNFERSTLSFCQAWFTDKNTFSLMTSGSTGPPKEVTFTRDQMIASAKMTGDALNLKSESTSLVCLDTKYIAGQMMLVRSFVIGMNIIAVEPGANPLNTFSKNQSIDLAAFVPYQVQAILNSAPEKLDNVKTAIIGGAPMDQTLRTQVQESKCETYVTYGMTETISHIALMKLNGSNSSEYFNTLPGVTIKKDERGCLIIKTDFLNEEVITNDLVELNGTKEFKWLGRWDNIINTGGVKVIPEKIESQLQKVFQTPEINRRYFLAGIEDKALGQKVHLIIEGDPLSKVTQDLLWIELKQTLSKFEVPKELKFVKDFRQTATGKIDRIRTLNLVPI